MSRVLLCVLNYSSRYSVRLSIAVYDNDIIVFCYIVLILWPCKPSPSVPIDWLLIVLRWPCAVDMTLKSSCLLTTELCHKLSFCVKSGMWRLYLTLFEHLSTIIGGSCHKYHFGRDKRSVAINSSFVSTKVCLDKIYLSRKTIRVCRDKNICGSSRQR